MFEPDERDLEIADLKRRLVDRQTAILQVVGYQTKWKRTEQAMTQELKTLRRKNMRLRAAVRTQARLIADCRDI